MNLDAALAASRSGLTAFAERAAVHATNLANVETTRTDAGGAFVPLLAAMQAEPLEAGSTGVRVEVSESGEPAVPRFDPGHPHADADGFVHLPAVDVTREATSLALVRRAYEANLGATKLGMQMNQHALDLAR